MSFISILIVDDDINKIVAIIETIKSVHSDTLAISQASNVQEAIENLQKKEFHLLVTDLQMPIKYDDKPSNEGGIVLVKNIYRKKNNINVPMYVVGLSQFTELQTSFHGVWKVWHYDSSLQSWRENLRDLIFHISLVQSRILSSKIETIFLEGPTDKKIIEESFDTFYPDIKPLIYLDTIKFGGGALWVERQLFIWAKSLTKNPSGQLYLKAVGVFDDDQAGNTSITRLRNAIDLHSAESKTFSIVKNSIKYSLILKGINAKGVCFPITLEELFSIECWKIAKINDWLEPRDLSSVFIDKNILDKSIGGDQNEVLASILTEDELLIVKNKIKDNKKQMFGDLVCSLDKDAKINALISIKYLLNDVIDKLKLTPEYKV